MLIFINSCHGESHGFSGTGLVQCPLFMMPVSVGCSCTRENEWTVPFAWVRPKAVLPSEAGAFIHPRNLFRGLSLPSQGSASRGPREKRMYSRSEVHGPAVQPHVFRMRQPEPTRRGSGERGPLQTGDKGNRWWHLRWL